MTNHTKGPASPYLAGPGRDHHLMSTTTERKARCRYRRLNDEACPNPALDQSEDAPIFVCVHHAARVLELVREHQG